MDQVLRAFRAGAALVLVTLGLAFAAAGLVAGMVSVKAGVDAACGSAFSPSDAVELTDTGRDTCQRERSDRQALALTLLTVAGVTLIGAAFVPAVVKVGQQAED